MQSTFWTVSARRTLKASESSDGYGYSGTGTLKGYRSRQIGSDEKVEEVIMSNFDGVKYVGNE